MMRDFCLFCIFLGDMLWRLYCSKDYGREGLSWGAELFKGCGGRSRGMWRWVVFRECWIGPGSFGLCLGIVVYRR